MVTDNVTAMLLQNLDESINTEFQNTENNLQKMWTISLKD